MIGNIIGALSIPMVLAVLFFLVQVLEASLGAGTGLEKKAKVIEAIKKLFEVMKWNLPFSDEVLSLLIDWLVWLFNYVIGFFQKSGVSASPAK